MVDLVNGKRMTGLKGFVVARLLYDDDNVLKWHAYYPEEFHGMPPHYGKTKEGAVRDFEKLWGKDYIKKHNDAIKVLPASRVIYLDRF